MAIEWNFKVSISPTYFIQEPGYTRGIRKDEVPPEIIAIATQTCFDPKISRMVSDFLLELNRAAKSLITMMEGQDGMDKR